MSALQPCPVCKNEPCCGDNPFTFSLVSGQVYANDQIAIDFVCPPGFRCIAGVYLIPKGTFTLVVPSDEVSTLRMQCCSSEIVQQVPAGATAEEIGVIAQNMVNACALQQANCNANATVRYGNRFRNQQQCYNGCANIGLNIGWTGSPPPLHPFFGYHQDVLLHLSEICIRPSVVVSSTSQNAANQLALKLLTDYVTGLLFDGTLDCGYWNTEQTCPDTEPPIVIPPFTTFSGVSQEDANEKAIEENCPGDCMAELAQIAYAGTNPSGGQGIQGRGGFSDKVFIAAGPAGILKIDTATNTLEAQWVFAEDIGAIAAKSNGLLVVFGSANCYTVSPVDGSVTNTFPYPGTLTLSYFSATPYNDLSDFTTVVCRGNIGPGNRDHIVSFDGGSPVVVYSSPSSFNSISAPGSYDPTRGQYNYKVLDSTTFPIGPERIVTFSALFAILNSSAINGIRNGDGLIYCSGNDSLYYWGRENVLGHGLYPVSPVTLAFGALILAGDSFPSGQLAYNPTTQVLAIRENGIITFVDTTTNTVACDGSIGNANENGISFSSDPQKLFVEISTGIVSVRRTP